MSLFLGKIHYWLFDKVLWFEGLEEEVIKLAKSQGVDIESVENYINNKYDPKLPSKDLEELIDKSNIHGWLQNKINNAEGRMAAWTKAVLDRKEDGFNKLETLYKNEGTISGEIEGKKMDVIDAEAIYNKLNDFLLDGMPCDRVNEIITLEKDFAYWRRRICTHQEVWENEGVNVEIFYKLRAEWAKAFVNRLNDKYDYMEVKDEIKIIKKE